MQHRNRVAAAVPKGGSLLVLASPDGADSKQYRSSIPGARVLAVNRDPHPRSGVAKAEMDEVLAEAAEASFDAVFYDGTSNSISMKALQDARRVVRGTFFLTLTSLRMRGGTEDLRRSYKARLRAAGFDVCHAEEYGSRGGRGGTMLFIEAAPSRPPGRARSDKIGSLAWVCCGEDKPVPGLALAAEANGEIRYVALVVDDDFGDGGESYKLHYYDSAMRLAKRAARRGVKAGSVSYSTAQSDYVEWVHKNEVRVQTLRGAQA
tara:strand:- start:7404 stop:8192 length:789 start_codon:yes stop_codon:yes gene_type:complete